MIQLEGLLGLGLVLLSAALLFALSIPGRGSRQPRSTLRPLPALQRLRRAIGLAVEEGKRLHISLGTANLLSPWNASALAGLSALERLTQLSRNSDRPPVTTSGEGALALLSQDTQHAAYRLGNSLELYHPDRGRLGGVTPFAYAAGTLPVIRDEQVSANLLIGHFGPEAALLCDAAEQQDAFTLAASDSLPAQAVLFAAAREPLIGEELFAIPAYLQAGAAHQASLRVQDLLRWGLLIVLLGGVLFKLIETLLGASF